MLGKVGSVSTRTPEFNRKVVERETERTWVCEETAGSLMSDSEFGFRELSRSSAASISQGEREELLLCRVAFAFSLI